MTLPTTLGIKLIKLLGTKGFLVVFFAFFNVPQGFSHFSRGERGDCLIPGGYLVDFTPLGTCKVI